MGVFAVVLRLLAFARRHPWLAVAVIVGIAWRCGSRADAPTEARHLQAAVLYRFSVLGDVRGRHLEATTTLSRRCADAPLDPGAWAGAFYFGGTSTAPHEVTALIHEYAL